MARHNAVMSKVTVSEESHTANSRTVRSIVGLIYSGTETSKHSAIPIIEKGDALATSCAYGAEAYRDLVFKMLMGFALVS